MLFERRLSHHGWRKRIQEVSGGSSHVSATFFGSALRYFDGFGSRLILSRSLPVGEIWKRSILRLLIRYIASCSANRRRKEQVQRGHFSTTGYEDTVQSSQPACRAGPGYQFYECTLVVSDMIGIIIKRQELFSCPTKTRKRCLIQF